MSSKAKGWAIAIAVCIGVAMAANGSSSTTTSNTRSTYDDDTTTDTSGLVTGEMVANAMSAADVRAFCDGLEILPEDMAYESFAGGYGYGMDPSAREVFDAMKDRC